MMDTCFLKPRGCSWCVYQTLFRKWCLFYLRFPNSSNHLIIAKGHHHHTPGCLNNELQAELQLRASVAITISQQIIFDTRSGTYHAANSTNIRHNKDMRPFASDHHAVWLGWEEENHQYCQYLWGFCISLSCKMVCPGCTCATHKYTKLRKQRSTTVPYPAGFYRHFCTTTSWSIRSDPTSWISKQWFSCNMYLNWIHDHLIISYMDP